MRHHAQLISLFLLLGQAATAAQTAQSAVPDGPLAVQRRPRFSVELVPAVPGYDHAFALAIGADGSITGNAATEPYSPFAVPIRVDAAGALSVLPVGDLSYGYAHGASGTGLIAGGFAGQPCLWIGGVPVVLPVFTFSGSARDVNAAGLVAGSVGDWDFNGAQHCAWASASSSPVVLKGILPGLTNGLATAVNDSGQIAGTSGATVSVFYAVRWPSPGASPLQIGPLPGSHNSDALDMNELGDVCGRSSKVGPGFKTEAFLYRSSGAQLVGLGFLPGGGEYSEARGLNDAQWVVGGANAGPGVAHAFLWIDGVLHDLNDLAAVHPEILHLQAAVDVNAAGWIAAEAVVGPGAHTRIAVLKPLP